LTRAQERAATATAALLVQLFFLSLFTHFLLTPEKQKERAREVLLLLRPSARPRLEPLPPPPTMPQQVSPAPAIPQVVPPLLPNPGPVGVKPEAPSGLEALGRALSGCTPEQMGRLAPEDRAKCPPLAAMPRPDQDLLAPPRSHAKDEAQWAEDLAERNWQPNCFGAAEVGRCLMQQSMEESDRANKARAVIAEQRRRRAQPPPPPMPKWIGQRNNR
jgi:hypothetical protein